MPSDYKKLFLFLYLLRLLLALAPGYVHPDEFFQSPEISAGHVLNVRNWIPWEYDADYPCRSIVFPMLTTAILDMSGLSINLITPLAVFATTRLAFFIYSFLIDYSIYRICRLNNQDPWRPMLIAASSYTLAVYHTRSFSNTIESILIGFVLWSFFDLVRHGLGRRAIHLHLTRRTALLGSLMMIGVFARITMVFFCIPVILAFCYVVDQRSGHRKIGSWWWRGQNIVYQAIPAIIGALITGVTCILVDSFYFRSIKLLAYDNPITWSDVWTYIQQPLLITTTPLSIEGSLTIAPWNNARYNMSTENLEQHGLHPHYLHALVNMPMLYGPLIWIAYKQLFNKIMKRELSSKLYFRTVNGYVTLIGVMALSLVPHQEARFLLPLLWILFNTIGAILFGVLHQSGIVPAINHIYTSSQYSQCSLSKEVNPLQLHCVPVTNDTIAITPNYPRRTKVIFNKTYMPPEHLFLQSNELDILGNSDVNVIDLGGSELSELVSQLITSRHYLSVSRTRLSNVYSTSNTKLNTTHPAIYVFNPEHDYYERNANFIPLYDTESDPLYERLWPIATIFLI
ncbi:Alg9-like mannosyltransferase family-domain-containing protein [Syncephalis plumigaleata]|nr:Alg9-like mannosyltransferase family-domain-containing protein [Syncephalis plumigaleata]